MKDDLQRLGEHGVAALGAGDAASARRAFERIEAAGQGSHQLRLLLAQACTLLDDRAAAHRVLDRVIADEPTNLYALIMRGDLLTRDQDLRAAGSWYQAALTQAAAPGRPPARSDRCLASGGDRGARSRRYISITSGRPSCGGRHLRG
jgi:predicted Zn-dependent protease